MIRRYFPLSIISIVMARHALFPETQIDSDLQASIDDVTDDSATGEAGDDLDALLATLEGWSSQDETQESSVKATSNSFNDPSAPDEGVLVDELQAWRSQHTEQSYDQWSPEKKEEFMVSVMILKILHPMEKETPLQI